MQCEVKGCGKPAQWLIVRAKSGYRLFRFCPYHMENAEKILFNFCHSYDMGVSYKRRAASRSC